MNVMDKPDWAMSKLDRENQERVAEGLAPKKRKGPKIVGGLVALAVIAGIGYAVMTPSEVVEEVTDAAPRIVQLAPFEVVTLTERPLAETLRVTGSLAPGRQVHLSAEVSARLVSVAAREGDAVTKGQVLAQFDVITLENQLAQQISTAAATRAQADQAKTQYERTQQLVEKGLAAPNQLDSARSSLDQLTASLAAQETAVENARTAIERATVTAPFDGIISERSVDPGAFVGTGSPLFTVVDLSQLEVEANAPVSAAAQLSPGQTVSFSVEGFDNRSFSGTVERINPMAISGSRMLPVYVSLDNSDGVLRGGMFASGFIVLDEKAAALALPTSALETDADGMQFVYQIKDGALERTAVEVARLWDGGAQAEIAAGLEIGAQVLAEPMAQLSAGARVSVIGE